MKKLLFIFALCSFISFSAFSDDKAAQDDIDELFEVMQAEKMIDTMYQQFGAMFDNMREQMGVQADEMPIYEKYNEKMINLMRAEMGWVQMKGDLKAIYSQNFTAEEIAELLKFYKSPVGQSFIEKMPVITQESMMLGQQMATNAMSKIQAIAQQLQNELQEHRAKSAD
ncbi:DUF2059 domain-containing protein [Glaciecola petra]|uniref:DUF2059 domain-containing protein n=1 Tax=Glaciecola petra TaxID=3075602 RepID=A0ABU2ZLP2_9ALTE|nr:DUF2059 domain-containing protein [Aestuariibacter sp. P117]MDT0593548.1 DUF2059 domain-containing protein [Aestuariibacter sp. P117]